MGDPLPQDRRAGWYAFAVIGSISCSMLMYQILLTRISALRLFFHFGFLVISNCLLGIGAAGTMITLFQDEWRRRPRRQIWLACVFYLVSLAFAYVGLITLTIPADLSFGEPSHFLRFTIFNLIAAAPFFAAGAAVGMVLTFHSHSVNRLYATDLVGAALGCLICPVVLAWSGAGGTVIVVALLALVGVVVATPAELQRRALVFGGLLAALGMWMIPRLDAVLPVPTKSWVNITSGAIQELGANLEFSRWSAGSRIDMVDVHPSKRFLFARGTEGLKIPLPEEKYISQDGSAGTFILNFSEHPEALRAVELSLYSSAVSLKERPSVFVIGVGGGNDVWAAKHAGARSVKGIELNGPIIDIHRKVLPHFSRDLLDDPGIELVHGEGRSQLMADPERYDVIQMSGIDTWTGLTSGAYILAENYLYTREAIREMYEHLADDGLLLITRYASDMEALRMLANVQAALDAMGLDGLDGSVICLETRDLLFSVMLKRGTFTPEEIAQTERFAEEAGIHPVYLPGRPTKGISLPSQFIRSKNKPDFIDEFPRDISPTTDDRPYFFNFTKWRNPLGGASHIAEPNSVSQGNPLFILLQLGLSTALALGLIVLPLLLSRRRHIDRQHAPRFLFYFLGLGAGFIGIEIALIQKLTLFLGHPLYSITVTLFCILLFTGLGSLASERWFAASRQREWLVPVGIAISLGLFIVFFPSVVDNCIGLPLPVRFAITAGALAPTTFLLGVPFAYGVRLLNDMNPSLVPWAWAVNGSFSVVGSVLTVVLSMNLGFNAVLVGAILVYAVSFASLPRSSAVTNAG